MQPATTAADLLAQLMSPLPHSTPAAIPFLQPFFPTQHQHQPTGHTVPQPMQPPFANSTFAQPPSFHTVNTPHYNTAMPGLQPLPHYNTATSGFQASPPLCGSSFTYQPTSHPTSTTPAQPFPTTPASQQYQHNIHMLITTQFSPSTYHLADVQRPSSTGSHGSPPNPGWRHLQNL